MGLDKPAAMDFGKEKLPVLKVVMALLIVAGHLPVFVSWPWLKPLHDLGAPIVSVFLFISGYGLVKSYGQGGREYLSRFFSHRVWRVILPALVATVLFYCFNWGPDTDVQGDFMKMLRYGDTMLPFSWFVPAIVYFYLVFYFVYSYLNDRWRLVTIVMGALIYMAGLIAIGYDRCWWVSSLAFPAGAVLAKYSGSVFGFFGRSIVRYILVVALLAMATVLLLYRWPQNQYVCAVSYVLIAIIVVLLAARLPVEMLNGPAVLFLASVSYEIYLCQGIPMYFFARKVPIANQSLYIVIVYFVTVMMAYAVHSLCVALSANKAK